MPTIVPRPRQTAGRKLTASEVDDQWQAHAEKLAAAFVAEDVFASAPDPTLYAGQLFHATDTGVIYRSDGVSWMVIAYAVDAVEIGFYGATAIPRPSFISDATGAGDVVAQFNALNQAFRALGFTAGLG